MIEEQLRDRGDWLGASCVCRYGDAGFLFPGELAGGTLTLSGLGGKVEPKESFRAAAERELVEETGVRPRIVDVEGRRLGDRAEAIPVPPGAGALIAQSASVQEPDRTLWIAVFTGLFPAPPLPVEKVSMFVVVPPAAFPTGGRLPGLAELGLLTGSVVRPAAGVVPPGTAVATALTARAVLGAAGLLAGWWARTS
jgi:8-oxo-dGTP pyrophosphatase MutT (NUDIX family)